jgi:hypothetical protein
MPTVDQDASVDVDVLSLLDFDPACEVVLATIWFGIVLNRPEPCLRPARWAIRCLVCKRLTLSCEEHLRELLQTERVCCEHCGSTGVARALIRWWPLDGDR